MVGQRFQADATVCEDAGHIGAGHRIDDEDQGDDHQWRAERSARSFEQQDQPRHGNHDILGCRPAGALCQLGIKQIKIRGAESGDQRQNPVNSRHILSRRAFERGVGHKAEKHRKSQVYRARLGTVEYTKADQKRQRRGDPQLKQRPYRCNAHQQIFGQAGGLAGTGITGGDQIFQFSVEVGGVAWLAHGCALLLCILIMVRQLSCRCSMPVGAAIGTRSRGPASGAAEMAAAR